MVFSVLAFKDGGEDCPKLVEDSKDTFKYSDEKLIPNVRAETALFHALLVGH